MPLSIQASNKTLLMGKIEDANLPKANSMSKMCVNKIHVILTTDTEEIVIFLFLHIKKSKQFIITLYVSILRPAIILDMQTILVIRADVLIL
jgi:hypothetical protein